MATETVPKKPVMVVGVDESDHSLYALEWTLDHFFTTATATAEGQDGAPNFHFDIVVVHAKPSPVTAIGLVGPGAGEVVATVDTDLRKIAARVVDKAKQMCSAKSVHNAKVEIWEGDAKIVLCESVERHRASMLVLGSHGYGAIKRALLGSVSDYCAHNAHCSVMIVKKPKHKH